MELCYKAFLSISILLTFFFVFSRNGGVFVSGLECYVCSNQTGNVEKCINTIKICEYGEDVCGTEIRWGSPPYFTQGALKQYYVSKRCMSKRECQTKRKRHMPYCTHIWYEDWSCHECCQGDRCNYYVISGANTRVCYFSTSVILIFVTIMSFLKRIY